jgi:Ran GTPase-activating protein (RanGAP) involved in mRNA processing and transport
VSPKFERLNISNNKIASEAFKRIVPSLAASKTLRLLELRYNNINSGDVDYLTGELKRSKNESLLYVELSGNKIKKESVDALEAILKANRSKNPISKDKLLMTGAVFADNIDRNERSSGNVGTFYMNKTNAIDDLSRENVVRHL